LKWVVVAGMVLYGFDMEIVVTLDCVDTETQAEFWLAALAPLKYRRAFDARPYLSLTSPTPAPTLLLQRVPEPKRGKNRMHLDVDLSTDDLAVEVDRLERLGAQQISGEHTEHGFRWVVLADPEGNEFCVFVPPEGSSTVE
jgi:hypothetical protein